MAEEDRVVSSDVPPFEVPLQRPPLAVFSEPEHLQILEVRAERTADCIVEDCRRRLGTCKSKARCRCSSASSVLRGLAMTAMTWRILLKTARTNAQGTRTMKEKKSV